VNDYIDIPCARARHARCTLCPLTSRESLMHEPESHGSYCSCMSRASSNDDHMRAKDPSRGALAAPKNAGLADAAARLHGTRWVCSFGDEHFHRRCRAHTAPWPRGRCLECVRAVRTASLRGQRPAEVCGGGARVWLHKATLIEQPRLSPTRSAMRYS
jgi:hypothetical protein